MKSYTFYGGGSLLLLLLYIGLGGVVLVGFVLIGAIVGSIVPAILLLLSKSKKSN